MYYLGHVEKALKEKLTKPRLIFRVYPEQAGMEVHAVAPVKQTFGTGRFITVIGKKRLELPKWNGPRLGSDWARM